MNKSILTQINKMASSLIEVRFMEVCGTHTMAIYRNGIQDLLPKNIKLISGPGCPVCVTPQSYIDKAIAYARKKDVIIATFGDMLRVPGSSSSLEEEKAKGANVKIVYSALDSLKIAKDNPSKKVIFLAVGFETTSPTVAATVLEAKKQKIKNFFILCSHKLIPPAIGTLLKDKEIKIDGFILPGHVTTVIGLDPYRSIRKPCVISGFEAEDVLLTILMLLKQIKSNKAKVENQYSRVVKSQGNIKALKLMNSVFNVTDSEWRGLGLIPKSGLSLNNRFKDFDIESNIKVRVDKEKVNKSCRCSDVLKGKAEPKDCKLFRKVCRPDNPVGACMVSSEGTCAAHYKYGR